MVTPVHVPAPLIVGPSMTNMLPVTRGGDVTAVRKNSLPAAIGIRARANAGDAVGAGRVNQGRAPGVLGCGHEKGLVWRAAGPFEAEPVALRYMNGRDEPKMPVITLGVGIFAAVYTVALIVF